MIFDLILFRVSQVLNRHVGSTYDCFTCGASLGFFGKDFQFKKCHSLLVFCLNKSIITKQNMVTTISFDNTEGIIYILFPLRGNLQWL